VKAAPSFAEAHFNLGLVREEQGRLDEAVASFEKALTLKPRLHGANLFLGVARYKQNHFDQALAAVRKETAAYPRDAAAWMWDVARIGAKSYTDNIVQLMVAKLKRLPGTTQQALTQFACLGNVAEIATTIGAFVTTFTVADADLLGSVVDLAVIVMVPPAGTVEVLLKIAATALAV